MISHEHKCIFIHIPKTAGQAVCRGLNISGKRRRCNFELEKQILDKHETITEALTLKHKCKDYFKLSFVRNPWDRMLSMWSYYKKRNIKPIADLDFNNFITDAEEFMRLVPDAYYSNSQRKVNILYPQFYFISDWYGNNAVDFVGRFENLQKDFNTVCDKIGIPHQRLPHINKSKHKHYTEYYDDETRQIVAEKYAKDIEYFGYEFGE